MSHTFECIQDMITLRKMRKNTDAIDIPNLKIKDFGKVGEKIVSYYDGLLSKRCANKKLERGNTNRGI